MDYNMSTSVVKKEILEWLLNFFEILNNNNIS